MKCPQCECKNGFYYDDSQVACVDIDECASNSNICDRNADCYNELGGYICRCRSGYYGNGFTCYAQEAAETVQPVEPSESAEPVESIETTESTESTEEQWFSTTDSTPSIPGLAPEPWLCDQCSEHADCIKGVCICRNGWNGDGIECAYNCRDFEVWNFDRCDPINSGSDEDESKLISFQSKIS